MTRTLVVRCRRALAVVVLLVAGSMIRVAFSGPSAAHGVTDPVTNERIGELTYGITPARILDTRPATTVDGQFANIGKLTKNSSPLVLTVRGRGGVPSAATGVMLNVTVTAPSGPGYLTVWPDGANPGTSTVNFAKDQTIANFAFAAIGSDGSIRIAVADADAHVLVDVVAFTSDLPTI